MMNLVENSIQLDNHSLVYYETGEGTPVLFIHGISTYSFIWRKIVPFFPNNYRLIVVDLFGCGKSDLKTDISFGITNHAKMLLMLMDKLNLYQYHVVAHDVGGGVAQVMSVLRPSVVLSVSLLNSVAYDFWPVQPIISARTPVFRQMAIATLDMWTLRLIVKRGLYHKKKLTAELMQLFKKPFKSKEGRKAFLHFASCLDNSDLLDIADELHSLDTYFLIIRGETDAYLSTAITEKLVTNLKNCESLIVPTGGHYIQEDEPGLVANSILTFIRKHEA